MGRRLDENLVRRLTRGVCVAVLLAAAGPIAAQPPAQPSVPAPAMPPSETTPAANVPPPAPLNGPAISEKDVAPAPPPTAQVSEKTTAAPTRRARFDIAVLQVLDKVTAETMRFEAHVGQPVRYKSLIFTVKACERAAPDEPFDDSIAYVTVDSQPRAASGHAVLPARQAYKGWMFASSPGLHPFEHPVYDAWLISCRATAPAPGAAPPKPSAKPTDAAPDTPPAPPAKPASAPTEAAPAAASASAPPAPVPPKPAAPPT